MHLFAISQHPQEAAKEVSRAKHGKRLTGIDLMRGVAAFGVICIHTNLIVEGRVTAAAQQVPTFFSFAVPFFLIAAFYFAICSESTTPLTLKDWLTKRAMRLLVPYAVWSTIYVFFRIGKYILTHQSGRITSIFSDPIGLAFFNGGGSLALYFVPLVFVGLLLTHIIHKLLQNLPSWTLFLALICAFGLSLFVDRTGNSYDLLSSQAFRGVFPTIKGIIPLRILLVVLAHSIFCLPFIFATALSARYISPSAPKRPAPAFLWLLVFVVLSLQAMMFIPIISQLRGITAFLLGYYASGIIPSNPLVKVIGNFSFGVYLVHQAVLQVVEVLGAKLHCIPAPLSTVEVLLAATFSYLVALAIVSIANQGGSRLRESFGIG